MVIICADWFSFCHLSKDSSLCDACSCECCRLSCSQLHLQTCTVPPSLVKSGLIGAPCMIEWQCTLMLKYIPTHFYQNPRHPLLDNFPLTPKGGGVWVGLVKHVTLHIILAFLVFLFWIFYHSHLVNTTKNALHCQCLIGCSCDS